MQNNRTYSIAPILRSRYLKYHFPLTVLLFSMSTVALSSDFSCRVSTGVYNPPGVIRLDDAATRDPSVIGKVFSVDRKTGNVAGDGIFGNAGEDVNVLRNVNEIINVFEVLSTNRHSDVKVLSIYQLKTKIHFKYYFGWLGLLLIGECNGTQPQAAQ